MQTYGTELFFIFYFVPCIFSLYVNGRYCHSENVINKTSNPSLELSIIPKVLLFVFVALMITMTGNWCWNEY